jgi:hypothetical protein
MVTHPTYYEVRSTRFGLVHFAHSDITVARNYAKTAKSVLLEIEQLPGATVEKVIGDYRPMAFANPALGD